MLITIGHVFDVYLAGLFSGFAIVLFGYMYFRKGKK